MAAKRNPFGIDPLSLLGPAVMIVGGMILINKLKELDFNKVAGDAAGNATTSIINNITSMIFGGGSERAQLVSVEHPPAPERSGSLNLKWTINHRGQAEHFRVGVWLMTWLGGYAYQTWEADIWTDDDPEWRSYSTGMTVWMDSRITVQDYFVGYVKDDSGKVLSKRQV